MKPVLNSCSPVGPACLLLCLALAACNGDKQTPAAAADSRTALHREGNLVVVPPQSPVLAQLKLAQVTQEQVQTLISAPANIEAEPEKMVKITPPVAGRLVRLHRQLGDPVKAGEALITMDSSDISGARADNAKAQSALLLARQNQFKEAVETAEKVAALEPKNLMVLAGVVDIAHRAGHKEMAIKHLRRGLVLVPGDLQLSQLLAQDFPSQMVAGKVVAPPLIGLHQFDKAQLDGCPFDPLQKIAQLMAVKPLEQHGVHLDLAKTGSPGRLQPVEYLFETIFPCDELELARIQAVDA